MSSRNSFVGAELSERSFAPVTLAQTPPTKRKPRGLFETYIKDLTVLQNDAETLPEKYSPEELHLLSKLRSTDNLTRTEGLLLEHAAFSFLQTAPPEPQKKLASQEREASVGEDPSEDEADGLDAFWWLS